SRRHLLAAAIMRVLPDCHSRWPRCRAALARDGLGGSGRLGPGPTPGGREAAVADILKINRPPAAGGITRGHAAWPERCSARIRLITHSKIGSARPGRPFRRAEIAAGA